MNEPIRPTVISDLKAGEFMQALDFDVNPLTEAMRERGVNETDIAAQTVYFSADAPQEEGYYTHGEYDPSTKTTTIFLGSALESAKKSLPVTAQAVKEVYEEKGGEATVADLVDIVNGTSSRQCSRTLYHELDHVVEDSTVETVVRQEARRKYAEKLLFIADNKKMAVATLAVLVMLAPFAEAYAGVRSEKTMEWTLAAGFLLAAIAAVMVARSPSDRKRHRNYLGSPWETDARSFAEERVQVDTPREELPLKLEFRSEALIGR